MVQVINYEKKSKLKNKQHTQTCVLMTSHTQGMDVWSHFSSPHCPASDLTWDAKAGEEVADLRSAL